MNDRVGEQMFDKNLPEKFPKMLDSIKMNFNKIQKLMEVCKNALTECDSTVDEVHSDMAELKSMVQYGAISSINSKPSLDANGSVQRRKRQRKITEPDIIEEITIDRCEENEDSSSTLKNIYYQGKKQKANQYVEDTLSGKEIYVVTQETDEECLPGPSGILKYSKNKQSHDSNLIEEETTRTTEAHLNEDVVARALKKSSGVLSEEQLNTFLYLANTLEDPVQVAKVSFTSDIKALYYQLITFHFHLKVANDVAANEKGIWCANLLMENEVERLVHLFQKEIS